jgi:hypothetical protein
MGIETSANSSNHAIFSRRAYSRDSNHFHLPLSPPRVSGPEGAKAWCVEHVQQLGGESPLHSLMEAKC